MAIEIGGCCKGRVTRTTAYGAFVALEGDGRAVSGMIHISELSPGFIREVSECVTVGESVTVKVLSIDEHGRIALSRRQAMTEEEQRAERAKLRGSRNTVRRQTEPTVDERGVPTEYTPYVRADSRHAAAPSDMGFEDMMRRFQAESEEKFGALRRSADGRKARRKR